MTDQQPDALTEPPAQDLGDEDPDALAAEEVIPEHDLDITTFEAEVDES